jgi:hypothetical protein
MNTKVEKGWRPGKAPLGYMNDKFGEKGKKTVPSDPERFPLTRKMWDLLLTGNYSVKRILEIATNDWGLKMRDGKSLGLSSLYRIFTNPFYYGEFMYNGELHQGKHEPMITRDEYDHAQAVLGNKGRPRPKTKRLPFSGLIRCECGGTIVAEEKFKTIPFAPSSQLAWFIGYTGGASYVDSGSRFIKGEKNPETREKYKSIGKYIFDKDPQGEHQNKNENQKNVVLFSNSTVIRRLGSLSRENFVETFSKQYLWTQSHTLSFAD